MRLPALLTLSLMYLRDRLYDRLFLGAKSSQSSASEHQFDDYEISLDRLQPESNLAKVARASAGHVEKRLRTLGDESQKEIAGKRAGRAVRGLHWAQL